MRPILVLPVLAAILAAPSARATESYDACTGYIETLPTVIGTPGIWCLKHDLATAIMTGKAIDIQVNNVTLDCNGFKLGNLAAGPLTQTVGIYAGGRSNITVRGCSTRGFRYGISLTSGAGHIIEDNRIEGAMWYGIHSTGDLALIRRNFVLDIGSPEETYVVGIAAGRANVTDNTVADVTSGNFGAGIYLLAPGGSIVTGNRITGTNAWDDFGIYHEYGHTQIHGNFLIGLNGGVGIRCAPGGTGLATDNLISDFETAESLCTVDGNRVNP